MHKGRGRGREGGGEGRGGEGRGGERGDERRETGDGETGRREGETGYGRGRWGRPYNDKGTKSVGEIQERESETVEVHTAVAKLYIYNRN
jgi:hypothetical protein